MMGTTTFTENIDRSENSSEVGLEAKAPTRIMDIPVLQPVPASKPMMVLSVLTVFLTIRYIVWRFCVTNWSLWWLALPLLAAELFTAAHILGYQYTVWPRRIPPLQPLEDASTLPIFLFIPTVNEGDDILRPTIAGALATRARFLEKYPDAKVRIIVCNDAYVAGVNNWQTVESLATSMGVECVTRQVRGGAKAGNIENARQSVKACGNSLLAILDADQVAEPEFLERTVAPFGDPDVGWVQTRQYYRNDNCLVSRLAESQASLFYDWVCPGKAATNASYICGTNVVIRASVLDQIGGMPTESVTEDFAASIRSHQSWRSVYLRETLAKGLGPLDLTGYFVQQGRWARGTMGVIRTDWKRLVRSGVGEMSGNQRLQYFLSGTHYLCGVRDFVFLSTALVSLYLSESPIQHVEPYVIFGFLLPYIFASQALLLLQSRKSSIVGGMVIGYISFPVLIASFIEAITNRKMRFHVTPKSVSTSSDLPAIVPHLLIVVICTFVLVHALLTHTAFTRTDAIPLFWVTYALCIILPTFFIAKLRPAH